eukprot:TRINITY_DN38939_c0_g1_i1.p1 TRINITY_DN38939_c0_g1~~TRINITY_DN38939_c0_g1_i1.p1  ORF type:complete len:204 (-),score=19.82 TRINITY_DN38939_c0_g1_i1:131-742(-)
MCIRDSINAEYGDSTTPHMAETEPKKPRVEGTTNAPVYTCACFCGAVKFTARGPPLWSALCHCSLCRRLGGGEVAAFAGFAPDCVSLVQGELHSHQSSENMIRHRCAVCGSPAYNESLMPDRPFRDFPLGALAVDEAGHADPAAREALAPKAHINYDMRTRDCGDELPKWRGMFDVALNADGSEAPAAPAESEAYDMITEKSV